MSAWIDVGFDLGRLGAAGFTLKENGSTVGTVSLAGQYVHVTDLTSVTVRSLDPVTGEEAYVFSENYVTFASALKTEMEAVGAGTYTVAFDADTRKYTITATGVTSFEMTSLNDQAAHLLGNIGLVSSLLSQSGGEAWHLSYPTNLGWSDWNRRSASPDGAEALIGSDGTARGLAPIGVPDLLDFSVPLEPREAIRSDESNSADYIAREWTWQRFGIRARSEPCVISTGDGQAWVAYLRPDWTLTPRLMARDMVEHQTIPLSFYVVGEVTL